MGIIVIGMIILFVELMKLVIEYNVIVWDVLFSILCFVDFLRILLYYYFNWKNMNGINYCLFDGLNEIFD